jgi:hypothetical protein
MDRLTIDKLNNHLNEYAKEQKELMDQLRGTNTLEEERPLREQLSAVDMAIRAVMKLRTSQRKILDAN